MSNRRKIRQLSEAECRCTECKGFLVSAACNCTQPRNCIRCTPAGIYIHPTGDELEREIRREAT
jgi:hypothetical protein